MAKAKIIKGGDGVQYLEFICPGCGRLAIPFTGSKAWQFNGSLEKSTLTPSILSIWSHDHGDGTKTDHCCHAYLTDGIMRFLGDCSHSNANQNIELPEIE